MPDATYIKAIDALWRGEIDVIGNAIYLLLCTSAYTRDVSASGDEFLSDVPSGAQVAMVELTGKTFSAGVFNANNPVFTGIAPGITITQGIILQGESPESGSRLIFSITDAPPFNTGGLLTDGEQITFLFPGDANKIANTHDE